MEVQSFELGNSPQVVERRVLDNGMVILTHKKQSEKLVQLHLGVNFGVGDEAAEHLGAAHFIEHAAFRGNPDVSAMEIIRSIEKGGGAVNASTDIEITEFYMTVKAGEVANALKVLYTILFRPDFGPVKIGKERKVIIQEMAESRHDYGKVLDDIFRGAIFKEHPAGRPLCGTRETIGAITREDLISYHQRYYAPNNMALAIVGDFDERSIDDVAKIFGPASPGQKNKRVLCPAVQQAAGGELPPHYMHNSDWQAYHLGAKLADGNEVVHTFHPDIYVVALIDYLLGEPERWSSRMNAEAREARSLTYDIGSDYGAGDDYGYYEVTFSREGDPTELLKVVIDELHGIGARPVTEYELSSIKGFAERQFSEQLIHIETMANRLVAYEMVEGGVGNYAAFPERISGITPEDIMRVANRWMNLGNITIASVVPQPK